jgi:CRP-like cAMP-binding protein
MADRFVEHLASVPLLSHCSKADLAKVARLSDEIDVPAGRVLITEGEFGHEAFLLVTGSVSVTRDGEEVATLGPGAVFGEMALVDRAPRNATVTATSDATVLVIGKREFTGLLDEAPDFRASIMAALADRVRRTDLQLFG